METSWKQHFCWKNFAGEELGLAGNVVPPRVFRMVFTGAVTQALSKHLQCLQHVCNKVLWPEESCWEVASGTGSKVGSGSKFRVGHTSLGQDSQDKLLTAMVQSDLSYSNAL